MKKLNLLLLNNFAGELVEIISDLQVTQSISISEEGAIAGPSTPMLINGFVADIDDIFLYLSEDQQNINQAIPITSIKHIQVVNIKTELDQLLDEFPEPESDTGYN